MIRTRMLLPDATFRLVAGSKWCNTFPKALFLRTEVDSSSNPSREPTPHFTRVLGLVQWKLPDQVLDIKALDVYDERNPPTAMLNSFMDLYCCPFLVL
jgi:hypothetical protein